MNISALTKALKFACLPTLSLLLLLFFAFFSISETIAFISSNDTLAVLLRIIAFLGEVSLVSYYYKKYLKEEVIKGNGTISGKREVGSRTSIYELNRDWHSKDSYYIHKTESPNIIYLERVFESSDY